MSWLYKTPRIGKKGKVFTLYKLRSLKENTDKWTENVRGQDYTWCGKWLRKYKLDELPQLWNIIKGDMVLVGPRPLPENEMEALPNEVKKQILSVKPGLTDLASVYFYNEEELIQKSGIPFDEYWLNIRPIKIVLQVFYVQHKCWILDLCLIWLTFKRMLGGLGKKS